MSGGERGRKDRAKLRISMLKQVMKQRIGDKGRTSQEEKSGPEQKGEEER